ncbi:MAG: ParB/RepB/Spo0J family partition protein [Betaproteobacteria bacterium]|nr:ParB/RepB/Spo0J family partition protein [Betaproteobacteria bacterium]
MSSLKKKGLGRGLDALLGGASPASTQKSAQQSLAISLLKPGKYQPRRAMNGQSLEELADSIRAQGIMQPLLVRPLARSAAGASSYEIIAGERRFRAAQIAGLKEVPVLVRDVDDQAALAMALIENLQREDLTVLEEAQGIDRLIREFGLTHEQAAKAVGRSRSATTNLLRLLQLPAPVQQLLREQTIDAGHARALLPLPAMQQRALAQRIVAEGLSVREAERLAAKSQATIASKKSGAKAAPPASRDWMRVQDQISDALGLPVVLKQARGGRGELTIRFSNMDELDGVIALLAPEGLPEA